MKQTLYIICPLFSRSGYGQHSRLIVNSLLNHVDKYDIKIILTRWGNTPQTAKTEKYLPFIHAGPITQQPDISIQIAIPNEFQRIGKVSIGISAVTESSVCSPEFIEGANKVDLVLVPSEFTKNVLLQTEIEKRDSQNNQTIEILKCRTPVRVLFEGLDLNIFNKNNVIRSEFVSQQLSIIKEDFVFLCVSAWLQGQLGEDRKNVGALIHLFLDVFKRKGSGNRPALLLKVHGAGFSEVEQAEVIDKIRQIQTLIEQSGFKGVLPSIYLLNGDLTDEEMNTLYNHPKVKSLVSLSHAEGYGLPLSEFTTTGKPVIAPAYSGQMDFLSKDHGAILLPGQMTKIHPSAANQWIINDSEWFTPNYQYTSQIVNDMYENYDKYLEKSRKHIKYSKDNFSLDLMEQKLIEILNEFDIKKPQMTIKLPQLKKL